ncbi:conserved hypothetical protein [Thermoplasma acidophilum]|uniref:DNA replication complex GINS family protein n=1 Tax=Thermoplasma acidophilum (strain ATCC 25905 / DSM 1728 / JCM 9062 / NBRC 15155 / AMRC-C165) TaxID=273075 RepID=Q9HJC8_THEAC|nr:hypothetical protein [Thermoplasma acidophilum]MCY0851775.1 DNA replication complex GINS family protein [Thermoplasma acidophilum]CAC12170.1 conserved hypothetical protein [Thermoplasma acidophilum]
MKPADIDKLISEIRTAIYAEQSHRKIIEIDPDIYRKVRAALSDLQAEASEYFQKQDIENYLTMNNRFQTLKRDFRSLFQRRFEKIVAKAIYDISGETLSLLTDEEKEFIEKIHNIITEEFESFIPKREEKNEARAEAQPAPADESPTAIADQKPQEEPQVVQDQHQPPAEIPSENIEIKKEDGRYVLVMITEDLPPIAQLDRNYSLHSNDLVYLPQDLASILAKRKVALVLDQ